ncbi:mechanosensitive ion channel family protein [Sneathiella sp. HT1-7]|uniref:mechanosensitive ion channel family protein n=1 Tax=Sneathiella sp. HT1-7 TaxID=2887192 RepID=UPI001D13F0B0|nr:mechanosensitive ion channel domain-containing protein [Sneathiella sp. HT1-7]MCC3303682.1 mechanosensitive ion channel [Sneathiella sp. HT1-7]
MAKFLSSLIKPRAWVAKLLLAFAVIGFLAFGYLGYLNPIREFLDSDTFAFNVGDVRFSAYLLVKALFIIILLFWLVGILSEMLENRIKSLRRIKSSNKALIIKAIQIVIYFLAFLFVFGVLGIDLTALTIFSGAVGIGIGFGLQKIASNFISGIILLFEKSVEEGDLIELNDGIVGYVRETGARYTRIETFEGHETMVPNEDFITNRVTNWTFSNSRARAEINIGVAYGTDLDLASTLIVEAAREHPRCMETPAPECFLVDFADSSINFTLYFWIENVTEGRMRPRSDVLFAIWRKFGENNIEIPFPQRDLHLKNSEALK